jgi:4-aminobutyrate aminotransferase-like enzyme
MLARLGMMQDKYACVGAVRGKGLLLGVDLVRDRKTREPVPKAVTQALYQECLRRGLAAMSYTTPIRINPPLVISEEMALEGLAILDDALEVVLREHGLQ